MTTELDWAACDDPERMLPYLQGAAASRKWRMFAALCVRQNSDMFCDERFIQAVECAERYADGKATEDERAAAEASAIDAFVELNHDEIDYHLAIPMQMLSKKYDLEQAAGVMRILNYSAQFFGDIQVDGIGLELEYEQVGWLKDMFGNPLRQVTPDPAWCTTSALALARQMYKSCDFSAMPILADALEEAGCDNPDVLDHCRQSGEHVRGCWVVDAVLGLK